MLAHARLKCRGCERIGLLKGDLNRLPFMDESFDAVTAGYSLRYPADLPRFLRDVHRLLRPGGLVLILDFGLPEGRTLRALARAYLLSFGAVWGLALHGRPRTYAHIVESLEAYPGQGGLEASLRSAGFTDVSIEEHLGGMAVTARARKR